MALFRKRSDPEAERLRAAFAVVGGSIDAAQRGLLAAIPTARDPGVPLAQGLAEFARNLDEAEEAMPAWRHERTSEAWGACERALAEARAEAERLRLQREDLGFEDLNVRVGDVLHPLERFADAERAVRRL